MNKLRQYFTPFTACVLALAVVLVPSVTFAADAEYWIQQIVWTILINISGMFLSAGGIVFDFAINSFVIGFADYYTNSGVGFAVDRTWVTIRDFVNLFFIFGLVYIGFKMILDANDSNTRRWLVNLIIAALLINFSLFITKFVIDFSNQISTQIAISGFDAQQVAGASATGLDSAYQVDISKKVLDLMGISSLFGLKGGGYNGYGWGYIFGTTIMFLVTAFVFFAGAFILTIRFAMLNLFMVLSPFMFIGWILPPLSNLTSKYWDVFFRRAFFAPVYFLFLYFSFEIMKAFRTSLPDLSNGNGGNMFSKADAAATIQATQSTLPFFILICIFLIASIVIAQKIGADGAGTAIRYGQMARNKLQRGVTRGVGAGTAGLAARAGRNTIGRYADSYANSDKAKDRASRSLVGKTLLKTARYGASASYDARNVGGIGKQLNLGESAKGGFKGRIEAAKKREDEFAKSLEFRDLSKAENKARADAEQKRIEDEATAAKTFAEESQKEFNDNLNTSTEEFSKGITALTEEIESLEKQLQEGTENGTLTDKDKAERQAVISAKQIDLRRSEGTLERLSRTEAKRNEWLTTRNQMNAVNSNAEASDADKAKARDAFEKAEAAYTQQISDERAAIQKQAAEADKKFKEAENEARASIKFERQRAYIEQQRRSERLWKSPATIGGSSASSGLLGAIVAGGGVGVFGFGAGAAAASAKGFEQEQIVSDLDEKYGSGGSKAIGKEKKKKAREAAAEALGNEEKKEEKAAPEGEGSAN
jgi:hypothetical protein